jgi:hypothetical protein
MLQLDDWRFLRVLNTVMYASAGRLARFECAEHGTVSFSWTIGAFCVF